LLPAALISTQNVKLLYLLHHTDDNKAHVVQYNRCDIKLLTLLVKKYYGTGKYINMCYGMDDSQLLKYDAELTDKQLLTFYRNLRSLRCRLKTFLWNTICFMEWMN